MFLSRKSQRLFLLFYPEFAQAFQGSLGECLPNLSRLHFILEDVASCSLALTREIVDAYFLTLTVESGKAVHVFSYEHEVASLISESVGVG